MINNKSKSQHAINELISTEELFVNDMKSIINGYGETIRTINCNDSLKKIFTVLDALTCFCNCSKEQFKFRMDNMIELSKYFIENTDKFSKYFSEYTLIYKNACDGLDAAMTNEKCANHLKRCQKSLNHALDLTSYLLKPIQRIMRYHLLIQSIMNDKKLNQAELESLNNANECMMSIANSINELRRTEEGYKRIIEISNRIINHNINPNLTGPVVMEDHFKIQNKKTARLVVLCEKIIFIFKKLPENKLSIIKGFKIKELVLFEFVNNNERAFEIKIYDHKKASIIIDAKTLENKKNWIIQIKRLLIQTMSLKLDDKNLEALLGSNKCKIKTHESFNMIKPSLNKDNVNILAESTIKPFISDQHFIRNHHLPAMKKKINPSSNQLLDILDISFPIIKNITSFNEVPNSNDEMNDTSINNLDVTLKILYSCQDNQLSQNEVPNNDKNELNKVDQVLNRIPINEIKIIQLPEEDLKKSSKEVTNEINVIETTTNLNYFKEKLPNKESNDNIKDDINTNIVYIQKQLLKNDSKDNINFFKKEFQENNDSISSKLNDAKNQINNHNKLISNEKLQDIDSINKAEIDKNSIETEKNTYSQSMIEIIAHFPTNEHKKHNSINNDDDDDDDDDDRNIIERNDSCTNIDENKEPSKDGTQESVNVDPRSSKILQNDEINKINCNNDRYNNNCNNNNNKNNDSYINNNDNQTTNFIPWSVNFLTKATALTKQLTTLGSSINPQRPNDDIFEKVNSQKSFTDHNHVKNEKNPINFISKSANKVLEIQKILASRANTDYVPSKLLDTSVVKNNFVKKRLNELRLLELKNQGKL